MGLLRFILPRTFDSMNTIHLARRLKLSFTNFKTACFAHAIH